MLFLLLRNSLRFCFRVRIIILFIHLFIHCRIVLHVCSIHLIYVRCSNIKLDYIWHLSAVLNTYIPTTFPIISTLLFFFLFSHPNFHIFSTLTKDYFGYILNWDNTYLSSVSLRQPFGFPLINLNFAGMFSFGLSFFRTIYLSICLSIYLCHSVYIYLSVLRLNIFLAFFQYISMFYMFFFCIF